MHRMSVQHCTVHHVLFDSKLKPLMYIVLYRDTIFATESHALTSLATLTEQCNIHRIDPCFQFGCAIMLHFPAKHVDLSNASPLNPSNTFSSSAWGGCSRGVGCGRGYVCVWVASTGTGISEHALYPIRPAVFQGACKQRAKLC